MTPSRTRFPGTVFAQTARVLLIPFIGGTMIWSAACLNGCAAHTGADQRARSLYVTEHPDMSGYFAQAIMAGQIMMGMAPEMVEAAWGRPQRIEKHRASGGGGAETASTSADPAAAGGVSEGGKVGGGAADRKPSAAASRNWDLKFVYGNYLMNRMVSNLYFEGGRLTLIENVDTNGSSSVSMDDPELRLLLPGQAPSQSGPAKGGGQLP